MSSGSSGQPKPTYFGQPGIQYPSFLPDGKTPIDQFLLACDGTVTFIGYLGSAFGYVSKDVDGNVTKLRQKYEQEQKRHTTLEDLLEDELKKRDKNKQYTYTLEGVLWLKRALDFMRHLLNLIVEMEESGDTCENMVPLIKPAYAATLKKNHSLPVQITFRGFMMMAPYKTPLLKKLAWDKENCGKQVIDDLKVYLQKMNPVVDKLVQFYDKNNLETDKKV